MKITKEYLKKVIKEELEEGLGGRKSGSFEDDENTQWTDGSTGVSKPTSSGEIKDSSGRGLPDPVRAIYNTAMEMNQQSANSGAALMKVGEAISRLSPQAIQKLKMIFMK